MAKQLEVLEAIEVPTEQDTRELAYRRGDKMDVFLNWHKEANILSIYVVDERAQQYFERVVPNDKGLDAFYHPFRYVSGLGEPMAFRPKVEQ